MARGEAPWGSRSNQPEVPRSLNCSGWRGGRFKRMCFLPQQLDSIHVTVLHKEEGAGLGFSLAGGADLENKVITVSGPTLGGA